MIEKLKHKKKDGIINLDGVDDPITQIVDKINEIVDEMNKK